MIWEEENGGLRGHKGLVQKFRKGSDFFSGGEGGREERGDNGDGHGGFYGALYTLTHRC